MDSIDAMNKALKYIDEHLCDETELSELAKIAMCSEYHFKRMFTYIAQMPLSQYIRKRKLSLAAIDLKDSDLRIIDIAIKYGYQSADAFSRAFYNCHNVLPKDARKENTMIKVYPKMTFALSIKGADEMKYRLVEKEAFKCVGLKKRVPIIFNGQNEEIIKLAQTLTPEIIRDLKSISNIEPKGIISASYHFSESRMDEKGECDHMIGVATDSNDTKGFESLEVDASTWAVFESIGPFPETLQNIWGRIYSEWFISSGYEAIEGPEIVWHEHPDITHPRYHSEIWIPVKKI